MSLYWSLKDSKHIDLISPNCYQLLITVAVILRVVLGSTVSALPGDLLERQIIGLYPRPTESGALWMAQ
jgi:hypothetical protein